MIPDKYYLVPTTFTIGAKKILEFCFRILSSKTDFFENHIFSILIQNRKKSEIFQKFKKFLETFENVPDNFWIL